MMSPAHMDGSTPPRVDQRSRRASSIGDDGSFSVVLSAERPAGHDGDWWELDPTDPPAPDAQVLVRLESRDRRAACAIERLDDGGADMSPEEIARRFSDMAAWIEGMIEFDMNLVRYYREHHGVNTFLRSTKIDSMGGLPKQAYYDGIHEIDDDEALIIETAASGEGAATGRRSSPTTASARWTG